MMTVSQAETALSAHRVGEDIAFQSVSTDSRSCPPGALFVALRGEKFDGHQFVGAVGERGAAAAMVDRASGLARSAPAIPMLEVENTRHELGRLAAYWRGCFEIPLIAVAGSNGKTTVKEMIAAILRREFGAEAVLSTEGNFNNDIGLPLTLLKLRKTHRAAVVEVGMNHPGETASLAAIAKPIIALVNNAQREHQEFMKSVAEVAREHAALFSALPASGMAIVNADDEFAPLWRDTARAAGANIVDFGLGTGAAIHAQFQQDRFSSRVTARTAQGTCEFELPMPGQHNVRNALGAIAAGMAAGASLAAAKSALQDFAAVKGRMQFKRGRGGAVLIDDTYNANPESVLAAIDVLAASPEPRVLLLGDMGEVGDRGREFHAEVGERARLAGITQIVTLGELSRAASEASGRGIHANSIEELVERARGFDAAGATLLVKGSRFMRMERVVEALSSQGGV